MLWALRKWFCMWAYSLVADLRFFLLPSFMLCITGNHVIFGVNLISVISVKDVFTSFQMPPKVSTEATRKFRLSMPTELMLMPKRWCNNFTKIWTHRQFYDLQYFAVFSDWCLYFLLIFGCLSLIFFAVCLTGLQDNRLGQAGSALYWHLDTGHQKIPGVNNLIWCWADAHP